MKCEFIHKINHSSHKRCASQDDGERLTRCEDKFSMKWISQHKEDRRVEEGGGGRGEKQEAGSRSRRWLRSRKSSRVRRRVRSRDRDRVRTRDRSGVRSRVRRRVRSKERSRKSYRKRSRVRAGGAGSRVGVGQAEQV